MTHVRHELVEKFPDRKDQIHQMKLDNPHFARLFDEYHELNREIHHAESLGQNISDTHAEDLKKQRLSLLDELTELLELDSGG